MEAFLNAIMADIANKFVALCMDKLFKVRTPTMEGKLQDLQWLLLRVRIIIEEAEGRRITNAAMVYQLNILRKEMYRGYFTLDSLKSQGNEENEAKDHDVSPSFAQSKFNTAKRIFFSTTDTRRDKDLQQVLDSLNKIMVHMNEYITFLNNYTPMYQQPYSMHLYVGKCMFGRQMEMDRVMDFLMQTEHPSTKNIGVLPIVGPTFVGKSTLVAHVCNDARVRSHFTQIVLVKEDNLNDKSLTTLKDGGVILHQDNTMGKNDQVLTVIELSREVDEVTWNSLYSFACGCLGSGSKMIVTSTSKTITKFGTTQALVLNFLPREAYWYFFKILTFGSVDSDDHPKLDTIAVDLARAFNGSFLGANVISTLLQKNLISQYWHTHHAFVKDIIQRNISRFGENPYVLARKNKPVSYRSNNKNMCAFQFRSSLAEENIPVITTQDVLTGRDECECEFEVFIWKSHIPPFKHYVANCMIDKSL